MASQKGVKIPEEMNSGPLGFQLVLDSYPVPTREPFLNVLLGFHKGLSLVGVNVQWAYSALGDKTSPCQQEIVRRLGFCNLKMDYSSCITGSQKNAARDCNMSSLFDFNRVKKSMVTDVKGGQGTLNLKDGNCPICCVSSSRLIIRHLIHFVAIDFNNCFLPMMYAPFFRKLTVTTR